MKQGVHFCSYCCVGRGEWLLEDDTNYDQRRNPVSPTHIPAMSQYPPKRSRSDEWFFQVARALYQFRPLARPTQTARKAIQVVCISDTHNKTPTLPAGDLLLHAGDLVEQGNLQELRAQIAWLDKQPFQHKVIIGGNHDEVLALAMPPSKSGSSARVEINSLARSTDQGTGMGNPRLAALINFKSVTYLDRATAALTFANGRTVRVHGDPRTPKFGPWTAFAYPRKEGDEAWAHKVPGGVDILLTHGPPLGYRDVNSWGGHVGCAGLLRKLWRTKPTLVVCGHIHECGEGRMGRVESLEWDSLQEGWEGILLRKEGWKTLIVMLLGLAARWLKRLGLLVGQRWKATRVVNAAVAMEGTGPVLVSL